MIAVPVHNHKATTVFLVLEDENITRLKAYDPAEFKLDKLPPGFPPVREVQIMYASAAEARELAGIQDIAQLVPMLKKLARGWRYRPEEGDSSSPYQRPNKQ